MMTNGDAPAEAAYALAGIYLNPRPEPEPDADEAISGQATFEAAREGESGERV